MLSRIVTTDDQAGTTKVPASFQVYRALAPADIVSSC